MEQTTDDRTLELSGSLDVRCIAELRTSVYALLDECDGDVYVDVSRVESVDMSTLKMLAAAALQVRRAGRTVVLRGCSPALRRVLAFGSWRRLFRLERGTS